MSERGHGKRCDRKIPYRTRREALEACAIQRKHQADPPPHLHPYRCRICRHWHLTSQPHDPRPPMHPAGDGGTGSVEEVHMAQIYRQGDVLLTRVDPPPALEDGFTPQRSENGRLILARGEVTGHHHSVAERDAEMIAGAEAIFLRIMAPTPLEHQEHAAITLEPGVYRVTRQREYAPQAMPRQVAD
jgi:hypothetical protein